MIKYAVDESERSIGQSGNSGSAQLARCVEISVESSGVYLLHYNSSGECFADTWHQSIGEAKEQAEFEYGSALSDWSESREPLGGKPEQNEIE